MNATKSIQPLTYHAIGHGHIDPVWLWRWQEGYEEIRATFRAALDRLGENPELHFIASSTAFYKWILEIDPAMFEEIRERVAEGRWNIVGGWIVEPDCNIPNGESFVRQGLYGQRFVREHFGFLVREAFTPDSFGHAGTLPQILKKSGFETYTYMRPSPGREMEYETTTFWWRSRDGSRVLAGCIPVCYDVRPEHIEQRFQALQKQTQLAPGQRQVMFFFGIGNHGGGPTKACISKIRGLQNDPKSPPIVFNGLSEYYKALREDLDEHELPVVESDLQHHARGCYTSHSEIKLHNRRAEHALMRAERWATVAASVCGVDYPRGDIQEAWETVLFQQFHDILAGTSIEPAYDDARDALGAACWKAEDIGNRARQRIASRVDTSGEGRCVMAFNPLPWPVRAPVEVPASVRRFLGERLHLVDDRGQDLPLQEIADKQVGNTAYTYIADLPGLGYRSYRMIAGESKTPEDTPGMLRASATEIENDYWRIRVDPNAGEIVSLFDKKARLEVLERGLSLCVMADQTDTWGHDLEEWRIEDGRFRITSARILEMGLCRATICLDSHYENSTARVLLTIYREMPDIQAEIQVHWHERSRVLKLAFDTNIADGTATFEAPYGCIEREKTGGEEPGQAWIDLTGSTQTEEGSEIPYGFAVINDCKYGYDVRGRSMRITLLRSPAYAHHDNARVRSDDANRYIDQGEHVIRLRLVPHAGSWQDAHIPRRAWEWNDPLWVHQESAHPGDLPAAASFVECGAENFVLTVAKHAEEDDSLVLRGYEAEGRSGVVNVRFPHFGQTTSFPVSAHEIKTLRSPSNGDWTETREVDLLEDDTDGHTLR